MNTWNSKCGDFEDYRLLVHDNHLSTGNLVSFRIDREGNPLFPYSRYLDKNFFYNCVPDFNPDQVLVLAEVVEGTETFIFRSVRVFHVSLSTGESVMDYISRGNFKGFIRVVLRKKWIEPENEAFFKKCGEFQEFSERKSR